jgi:hypothetical protein
MGDWLKLDPCPDKQTCFNREVDSSLNQFKGECSSSGCDADGDGINDLDSGTSKCFNEEKKIKSCLDGVITEVGCGEGCFDDKGIPKCKEKYGEVLCISTNGTPSSVGTTQCDDAANTVVVCTENGDSNDYSVVKKCNSGKQCYLIKGKYDCYTPDEITTSGTVYKSSLTSVTSVNGAFFCDGDKGIRTAFGCIPMTIEKLLDKFLPVLLGIAGGIAFLMMVYGFILIATSSGDEKKVQAAKQTITSAITGLLVSIFALLIYRLIAVNILHIPGIN